MHRKVVLALQPNTAPREPSSSPSRTGRATPRPAVPRPRPLRVDLRAACTPEPRRRRLRRLPAAADGEITRGGDGGRARTRVGGRREVMRTHFNRRERAQADEPPGNYTFTECYSKWLVYWSRDTRRQGGAKGSLVIELTRPPAAARHDVSAPQGSEAATARALSGWCASAGQSSPEPSRAPPGGKQVVRLAPLPGGDDGAAVATTPPPPRSERSAGAAASTSPPDRPPPTGIALAAAILRRDPSPVRPPPEPSATCPPRPPRCRRRPTASRRRTAAPRPRRATAAHRRRAAARAPPTAVLLSLCLRPATRRAGAVRRHRQPLAPKGAGARRLRPQLRGGRLSVARQGAAAAAGGRRGRRGAATPTADARCLDSLTGSAAASAAAARAARAARAASAQRPGRRPSAHSDRRRRASLRPSRGLPGSGALGGRRGETALPRGRSRARCRPRGT